MMTRKISTTPEMRRKYHEKVSKPPVVGLAAAPYEETILRGSEEVWVAMRLFPPSGLPQERCTAIRASWARAEDRRDHEESHRDEAGNRQQQHANEHRALIFVPGWPKVNQDDAHAVECVVEHRADQRQRDESHDTGAEDQ